MKSTTHKPSWNTYFRLGRTAAKQLETHSTFEEIAKEFGLKNKQEARWRCLVALGKMVHRARVALQK